MSFAYHGNWCGPGWTAGKYKSASKMTKEEEEVPAKDALDLACKHHDIGLKYAKTRAQVKRVNKLFYKEAATTGIKGKIAAALVAVAGPSNPGTFIIRFAKSWEEQESTFVMKWK